MTNDVIKEAVAKQQSGDRKLVADNTILGKVMTFNIGEQVYGIEIQHVVEIIGMQRITKVPHVPDYIKGIEMIVKQFNALADNLKIVEIAQPGDTFDPTLHEAVMHIEDEALGENVIAEVLQKG